MKKIKVKLKKSRLLERVQTHCYYTGEARKQIGFPEPLAAAIQASDDDTAQLNDHIGVAAGEVAKIVSRFLAACSTVENGNASHPDIFETEFNLSVPDNFPDETISLLTTAIENYCVARTLQLWLAQHKPDESAIIANEAQQAMYNIRELLSVRKRPTIGNTPFENLIKI